MLLWLKFIEYIASKLKSWTIPLDDGSPYLTRHYILNKKRFSIFLHKFHASDEPIIFHNHPWAFSFSIILYGSYLEFRSYKNNKLIKTKIVFPGYINYINSKIFHRVDLLTKCVWTLFFTGKNKFKYDENNQVVLDKKGNPATDWYFWNSETDETFFWTKRNGAIG